MSSSMNKHMAFQYAYQRKKPQLKMTIRRVWARKPRNSKTSSALVYSGYSRWVDPQPDENLLPLYPSTRQQRIVWVFCPSYALCFVGSVLPSSLSDPGSHSKVTRPPFPATVGIQRNRMLYLTTRVLDTVTHLH